MGSVNTSPAVLRCAVRRDTTPFRIPLRRDECCAIIENKYSVALSSPSSSLFIKPLPHSSRTTSAPRSLHHGPQHVIPAVCGPFGCNAMHVGKSPGLADLFPPQEHGSPPCFSLPIRAQLDHSSHERRIQGPPCDFRILLERINSRHQASKMDDQNATAEESGNGSNTSRSITRRTSARSPHRTPALQRRDPAPHAAALPLRVL